MTKNKKAFTLIELLVVVLIIGILAAVALPQYQKAVDRSKVTKIWVILDFLRKNATEVFLAEGTLPAYGGITDELVAEAIGKSYCTKPNSMGAKSAYCAYPCPTSRMTSCAVGLVISDGKLIGSSFVFVQRATGNSFVLTHNKRYCTGSTIVCKSYGVETE